MCVDYANLNSACPKDNYPLPSIDHLVDKSLSVQMLSFMDAHTRYNHVQMEEEDEEKTMFITDEGTFGYMRMTFGLKNAGVIFQRLMDKVFLSQAECNVEAYVDDILVRMELGEDHIRDLEETFENVTKVDLRLKEKKCIFGVQEGNS